VIILTKKCVHSTLRVWILAHSLTTDPFKLMPKVSCVLFVGGCSPVPLQVKQAFVGKDHVGDVPLHLKIASGLTTGAIAITVASPTDLVKVRGCVYIERVHPASAGTIQKCDSPKLRISVCWVGGGGGHTGSGSRGLQTAQHDSIQHSI
jgi:hypothetical protein